MKCFSPSILYAGIHEARLFGQLSEVGRANVAEVIRHGPASLAQFDYQTAHWVEETYGPSVFSDSFDNVTAFRLSISNLMRRTKPPWRSALPLGRAILLSQLDPDARQCFDIGALTADAPDLECAQWWKEEADIVRAEALIARDEAWHRAEYRSLMLEREKLNGSGLEPKWVSVDDNSAGYDIESWLQPTPSSDYIKKFIEVKHSSSIPRFFISRPEWMFAERHTSTWELHFWFKNNDVPVTFDVTRLREDIAINQGNGKWDTMKIGVESEWKY